MGSGSVADLLGIEPTLPGIETRRDRQFSPLWRNGTITRHRGLIFLPGMQTYPIRYVIINRSL